MTQAELADKLGITQAALSNYELGKRRLYLHQIQDIAGLLGRGLRFFISQEENPGPIEGAGKLETLRLRIADRVRHLEEPDLRQVEQYLDYLEWKEHRNA